MNSKTTGIWFVFAVALGVFIFVYRHYFHPALTVPSAVLPQLKMASVTSVRVVPSGAPEICAVRTNGDWFLTEPLYYPGQTAAIESLLEAIQKLVPAPRITAAEMSAHKDAETEFGFARSQLSLVIESGDRRWQLVVGNKTAPGNQVYLRVVGVDGAFVVDTDWLKLVPHTADEWRDTSLVDAQRDFDSITITNGTKIIELRRNPTNHLWRMLRPLNARADSGQIATDIQQLKSARITQFVTDNPNADLTQYGLQPPDLDLWFGRQTNFAAALHIGKSPANDSTQVYAKREGWNAIFKVSKDLLLPWYGQVNSFRDSHLLELTAPVAEIEMRFQNTNDDFILRRQGTNDWIIVGKKYPSDADSVQNFLKELTDLRVSEFVKDVVTPPDLPVYGLDKPHEEIILRSAAGGSNAVIAQLNFGTNQDDKIFVKRSNEDFIYAVTRQAFQQLPNAAWELRDRHIWDFKVDDVAQITLRQNGMTRQIIHTGHGKWSLAPGSQGIIADGSIEQAVEHLSQLTSSAWAARGGNPAEWGFDPNNLQITVELKDGKKFTVDFGLEIQQLHTALAAVTLDGERWTFEFPPVTYQFVVSYLTIPPNLQRSPSSP